MSPERWSRIQEVFILALDCEPAQRAVCLDAACSGDISLREEVASLLNSEPDAPQFLAAAVNRAMDSYRAGAATLAQGIEFQGTARFSIQNRLGAGGFGTVYRAFDHERNATVALKTLHRLDTAQLLSLKREFRSLADISHPNVVVLYELVSDGGQCFFTMELIEGVSFREYASSPARLRAALGQLAEGVSALHRAGKLHRDLKPSNVLVTSEGRVVVLDFGLATDTIHAGAHANEPVAGTPAYMSPEQKAGRMLSEASDWYSVGIMLYEALTGGLPLAGPDFRPPNESAPGIPEDLNRLCIDLLQRDPSRRPSGNEVSRRLGLRRAADAAGVSSRTSPFVGRHAQLRALKEAFESAKTGRPATIFIHGSSGSGKTALIEHFLDSLQENDGALVLAGRCYERESVPYKAVDSLVDVLSAHLAKLPGREINELRPDISSLAQMFPVLRGFNVVEEHNASVSDVQEQRRRGFSALRELLKRLAMQTPVVLFIDDLQWGDSDSAMLMAETLRPPDAPPVLFLGSYRTEDAATSQFLQEFWSYESRSRTAHSTRLPVEELSFEEARELASTLLGPQQQIPSGSIASHSKGNPFFITELARYMQSRDELQPVAEDPSVDELVQARVSLLPEPARLFLEVVAVAGQPVDITIARRALETAEDERAILGVLRAARLIRIRTTTLGQEVETYHDRIRESLSGALPAQRSRDLHLRLGRALESAADRRPDVLAMHFAAAGCRPEALHYATQAADQAAAALAFASAARFCRMALALDPGVDLMLSLEQKLGEALSNAGRGAEAAQAYLKAADLAGSYEALECRRRAAWQYLISGHVDQGRDVIQTLLKAIGMKLARSPRRALLSMALRRVGIRLRGLGYRERAAGQVPKKDLIRIDTCFSVTQGLGFIDTIHAADFQGRHLLLALRSGEKYRVARALCVEAAYHGLAGTRRAARTRQLLEAATKLSITCDNPHALGFSILITGTCGFLQGKWKEARESFARAEAVLLERCAGSIWELATARLQGSACSFFLGEWKELGLRLPALLADADARGDLYLATALRTRLGHANLLAEDRPEEALQLIRSAIGRWSVQGFHTQHWWSLTSQCDVFLYQNRAAEAWKLIQEEWPALGRSLLLRIQYFRIESLYHRASTALAMATDGATNRQRRDHFLCVARDDAERIGRENTIWGNGLAHLLGALVFAAQGRQEHAERLFLSAEQILDSAGMHLFAASARRRRGELIKGNQGASLAQTADLRMLQEGIQSPEHLAGMLAPRGWN